MGCASSSEAADAKKRRPAGKRGKRRRRPAREPQQPTQEPRRRAAGSTPTPPAEPCPDAARRQSSPRSASLKSENNPLDQPPDRPLHELATSGRDDDPRRRVSFAKASGDGSRDDTGSTDGTPKQKTRQMSTATSFLTTSLSEGRMTLEPTASTTAARTAVLAEQIAQHGVTDEVEQYVDEIQAADAVDRLRHLRTGQDRRVQRWLHNIGDPTQSPATPL